MGWLLEQWKNDPSGCLGHIGDYTILPSYMFYFFTWQVKVDGSIEVLAILGRYPDAHWKLN